MSLRHSVLTLFTLFGLPAISAAGPIEFDLTSVQFWTDLNAPALGMTLSPTLPPGAVYNFNPATGQPTAVGVIGYQPSRIPNPAPIDIHPDGTTHWNNEGFFGITVKLTDVASGQSADLSFGGRAHMYNGFSTSFGWGGVTFFWFMDEASVTLGGKDYTIWGTNWYDTGPPTLDVWVGPNPPVNLAPEPGTLLLGALGLAPLGLRPFASLVANGPASAGRV